MILALAVASTFAYTFPTSPTSYKVEMSFDGYLPIFGGTEAKVDANVGLKVQGDKPDAEGKPQLTTDLTDLKVLFDGEAMPFNVDSVRPYFPKTTISISPQGKVLKTNAPNVNLPVRLPGLDVKRFPETTFLPVEFPEEGIEVGKSFQYKRPFGDSEVIYDVTPTKIEGNTISLALKVSQTYETLEDEAKNLTKIEKDAFLRVKTEVSGTGTATYDSVKGQLMRFELFADSSSVATPIKGGEAEKRKLKTKMTVKRG